MRLIAVSLAVVVSPWFRTCCHQPIDAPHDPDASTAEVLPDPETYCQQPPDDECWPCGAAARSSMAVPMDSTCSEGCAAYVANLGSGCTGRCTSENRCIIDCPAATQCSSLDPASDDCKPQCGSGSGGRIYRHMDECFETPCNDLANEDGTRPNCHGRCVTTDTCKIEC